MVNAALKALLQDWASARRGPASGADLLAGFMHTFPHWRGRLAEAWKAHGVWVRATPHRTRVPLDETLLRAMLSIAVFWGWSRTAAALALGFYGLLRPGELCQIRRVHWKLPSEVRGTVGDGVVLAFMRAKTRYRAARLQSVVLRDSTAILLLESVSRGMPSRQHLVPDGVLGLHRRFNHLLAALGAHRLPFSPASLRGGGAVHMLRGHGASLTEIMFAGRWESVRTVSRYLQEGLAAYAVSHLDAVTAAHVSLAAALLQDILR